MTIKKAILYLLLLFRKVKYDLVNNDLYLSKVLTNLNTNIEPCEDFYQFACGNWHANYDSEDYMDMPGFMEYTVEQQLLRIIKTNRHKSGIYEKVWLHFSSCENLKHPALYNYLKHVEPELNFQWPIFRISENWKNETEFDWLSTIARLRVYGLNGVFLTQKIYPRFTNGSHFLLEVHQHQSHMELQFDDIYDIFKKIGLSETKIKSVSNKIIALEKNMKNLTIHDSVIKYEDDDQLYKKSFKEYTIKELSEKLPEIDWKKYFNIVLDRDVNINVETVQTHALNISYFTHLQNILQQTSNEIISLYIMLKFIYHLKNDNLILENDSTHCVKHLRGFMPLAMDFLYEEHIYKSKRHVIDATLQNIFNKLRENFQKIISENFLNLDDKEQAYIIAELQTMKLKIGNIPEKLNRKFVEDYYSSITMDKANFHANHLKLIKLNTRREQMKLLNKLIPPDMQFYDLGPKTASSSSPIKIFNNVIIVPYGYLQLPLFDHKLNSLFQYSLFGFIIAHEIIHAFDLYHVVYDEYGNYNELGVSVKHHFWKHMNRFARRTSENIADISGLRLVYQTYFDDVAKNCDQIIEFPTLAYSIFTSSLSEQQLFFINSVQFLCANMEKISSSNLETLDLRHGMHDVRVQQNWADFEPFAAAFNCASGTAMNPAYKFRLWR